VRFLRTTKNAQSPRRSVYEAFIARLTELEDLTLAYEAQLAFANSQMVGVAKFTQAISAKASDKA